MIATQTKLVCQSCGMPMSNPGDHGTDLGGAIDEDYCRYCFRDGLFTQPDISMDEMVERMSGFAREMHMSPDEAVLRAKRLLPHLKRWRDTTP